MLSHPLVEYFNEHTDILICLSVCPSACHKKAITWLISSKIPNKKELIFRMDEPVNITFQLAPCNDFDF